MSRSRNTLVLAPFNPAVTVKDIFVGFYLFNTLLLLIITPKNNLKTENFKTRVNSSLHDIFVVFRKESLIRNFRKKTVLQVYKALYSSDM